MRPSHAPASALGLPRARAGGRAAAAAACAGLLALLLGAVLAPAGALAADPTPQPPDPFPTVQTWIDGTIDAPPDAPAGGQVLLGVTFWNVRDHKLFAINGLVARLYPAKGKAEPSVAKLQSDAPGHATAQLQIPKGGVGRVEIDTSGQECTTGGSCKSVYQPLRIAGTGPPPEAPLGDLVLAELLPITGDVVAGRPTSIAVNIRPIGLWAADALQLPPTLQVVISRVGGGRLGNAQLQADPPEPGQPYQGTIRVPEPGQMSLKASFVDANGATQPINSELGPIQVIGAGVRPDGASPRPAATAGSPAAPAPGETPSGADAGPPWLLIGALTVLVLGLVLFLGDPIRRRLRGGGDDGP